MPHQGAMINSGIILELERMLLLLLLDFTTIFNILGHHRRFRNRAPKVRQILLRGSTRLYFPSEGSHTQDFYALKKSIDPGRDRTREHQIQRSV